MNLFLTSIVDAANQGQQAARDKKRASDCPYKNMSSPQARVWLQAFDQELMVMLRLRVMQSFILPNHLICKRRKAA